MQLEKCLLRSGSGERRRYTRRRDRYPPGLVREASIVACAGTREGAVGWAEYVDQGGAADGQIECGRLVEQRLGGYVAA